MDNHNEILEEWLNQTVEQYRNDKTFDFKLLESNLAFNKLTN